MGPRRPNARILIRSGECYTQQQGRDVDSEFRLPLGVAAGVELGSEAQPAPLPPDGRDVKADEDAAAGVVVRAVRVQEARRLEADVELTPRREVRPHEQRCAG